MDGHVRGGVDTHSKLELRGYSMRHSLLFFSFWVSSQLDGFLNYYKKCTFLFVTADTNPAAKLSTL